MSEANRKEPACTNAKYPFYGERDSKVPRAPPCSATLRGASLLPEEGSKSLEFPYMGACALPKANKFPLAEICEQLQKEIDYEKDRLY